MRVSPFVAELVFRDCPQCHAEVTFDRKPESLRVGMTIVCPHCTVRFDVCACGAASSPARCRRCARLLFDKDVNANNDVLNFDRDSFSTVRDGMRLAEKKNVKFAEIARHLELANRALLELYTRMLALEAKVASIPRKLDEILEAIRFMPPSHGVEYAAPKSSFDSTASTQKI